MKRRLFKLVVFLLLGAVVNVAVAWGCAVSINPFEVKYQNAYHTFHYGWWEVVRFDRFGTTWVASARQKRKKTIWNREEEIVSGAPEQLAPKWSGLRTWSDNFQFSSVDYQSRHFDGRGWPMRSLWCEVGGNIWVDELGRGDGETVSQPVQGGIEISLSPWPRQGFSPPPRVLPLRPIPLGIAINTIVYAAILWLPFAPFALRRFIRRRRGLCIKCGYDLRGAEHEACPECRATT